MPVAPNLAGVALDGRYELHALIGEGSFGCVYRGHDRRLARPVAVKVIKPWWAEDPEWVRSFEREAQLLASINDPGIVQIFDVGSAPQGLYYVAELVDGESLAARLQSGPIDPAQAAGIAEQLARALGRAHIKRVIHRDVKPANVLISAGGRIKVSDFGVARLATATSDAGAGTIVGTPRYMAPEQARGDLAGPAGDVYGAGIVLYEMLAGQPPFAATTVVELALAHLHDEPPPLPSHVPRALDEVVGRALRKDPRERYADGDALADGLARAREEMEERTGEDEIADGWQESEGPGGPIGAAGATSTLTPTRVLRKPSSAPRSAPTRVGEPMSPRRKFNPAERRQRIALLSTVVALGIAMVAAAFALSPGHLTVPTLRGMTRGHVQAVARRLGFRAVFTTRYSSAPSGMAIAQSPAARTRVTDGTTVAVVLSRGPAPVTVPEVVGSASSAAQAALSQTRLHAAVTQVPAPGASTGTVTRQSPSGGTTLAPGSTVSLSVAEPPQWRGLTSFSGSSGGHSVPFRIRGSRWKIAYSMGYQGTCTFIFFCSGPSATVTNASTGQVVDQFDLNDGSSQIHSFKSGPGVYQIAVSPGSDSAHWSIVVQDYY